MKPIYKYILVLFILISGITFYQCTKKVDIDKYGEISGKVKDAVGGEPIAGAVVTLNPSNSSATTGSDGAYGFNELEPRQYTIQVMKDGYVTNSTSVDVVAGENRLGDILLTPAQPILRVSVTLLDFGTDKNILPFEIHNDGAASLNWSIADDKEWITVNPVTGNTTANISTVNVTIDRNQLGKTEYTGTVVVSSNGGSATINVRVNVSGPLLKVTPEILDFGATDTEKTLQVSNIGIGSLTYNAVCSQTWVTLQNASGTTTTEIRIMPVLVNRGSLLPGTYSGEIVINSNGGNFTVPVSMQVAAPAPPQVVNGTVSDQTPISANISGNLTSLGSAAVTQHGHCWSTSPTPTIENNKTMLGQATVPGDFSSNLTGLTPSTPYYVRAYATNSVGTAYSYEVTFTTNSLTAPQITNGTASDINYNSAKVSANLTSLGNTPVTQHGHCWSTSPAPTTENYKTSLGSATATGSYSSDMTGLSPSTPYYVRAYAINSAGTTYSNEITFSTNSLTTPELVNGTVSNLTFNSAQVSANLTALGNTAVTQHGHCWSTTPAPTVENYKTALGSASSTGNYTSNLNGLNPSTPYYVRAYATNSAGTAYSNEVTFTTSSLDPPQVINGSANTITYNSAEVTGIITYLGNTPVTQHGHCWNTSPNPTLDNSKTSLGSINSTGEYSSQLTGLSASTPYYVRAYATNSAGTTFSNDITFTTDDPPSLATVTTTPNPTVNGVSVTLQGEIIDLGDGLVTQHGHCYGTSPNPTITGPKTQLGTKTNPGTFASNVDELQPLTTYYFRAYATNSMGTAYGEQEEFITENAPPVVTSGLISYFTFDNQDAQDDWGDYNGIPNNINFSTNTPTGSGYAAQFDGSSSYISILHAYYSGSMSFTFCVWVRTSNNGFEFYNQNGGIYTDNGVAIDQNNKVYYAMNGLSWYTFTNPATSLLDNTWRHFVYRRQANTLEYYIDGVLMDTRIESSGMHENIKTHIGTNKQVNGWFYEGSFDNIRFFNRALSQSEILEIYDARQ